MSTSERQYESEVKRWSLRRGKHEAAATKRRTRVVRAPLLFGAVLAIILGVGAGAAWGYFTTQGSGSAAATVGHVTAVTVLSASGTTATPKLQPGSHGDLKFNVTNPNSYTVTIVHIIQKTGAVGVSNSKGTCTGTRADISVPAKTVSYTIPTGTHAITIVTGAYMGTTSPTGCQGATFSIPVTLTVERR